MSIFDKKEPDGRGAIGQGVRSQRMGIKGIIEPNPEPVVPKHVMPQDVSDIEAAGKTAHLNLLRRIDDIQGRGSLTGEKYAEDDSNPQGATAATAPYQVTDIPPRRRFPWMAIVAVIAVIAVIIIGLAIWQFMKGGQGGNAGTDSSSAQPTVMSRIPSSTPTAEGEAMFPDGKWPNGADGAYMGVVTLIKPNTPVHMAVQQDSQVISVTLQATMDPEQGLGMKANDGFHPQPMTSEQVTAAKFVVGPLKGHVDGPTFPDGRSNPANQQRVIFDRQPGSPNAEILLQEGESVGVFVGGETHESYALVTYTGGMSVTFDLFKGVKGENPDLIGTFAFNVTNDAIELATDAGLVRLGSYVVDGEQNTLHLVLPLAPFNPTLEPTPQPTVGPEEPTPEPTSTPD